MKKFVDKLSGSICFSKYFSVLDISGITNKAVDTIINTTKSNLTNKYKKVYFSEDESEILNDISTAQKFLHSSGLPFKPKRAIIDDFKITHVSLPVKNSTILFTLFPEVGILSLSLNLNFEDASTNEAVFLRQCSGNGEKFIVTYENGNTKYSSIKEIFQDLINSLQINGSSKSSCLIEINKFGNIEDVNQIVDSESLRVYGLMTGDEGFEFVPKDLSLTRLENAWGSRKFVKFIAFDNNFLLINLNSSKVQSDYEKHQNNFTAKYYDQINPYFNMKSNFAGVNHGILFCIETVMSVKTVTNYILDRQTFFRAYQNEKFSVAIKRTKTYRKDLMLTLNKIEQLDISELGELENLILKSQHIDPIVEKIKYLLELLESDLTLMYSQQTNKMVNILTIFGILISVIGLILDIISFIG